MVKLIKADGTVVAEYTYNAWCEILSSSGEMAVTNHLRYRSYYYDIETGFYYLQSRYYDPATHRFINADHPEYSTMSAYSLNDSNLWYFGNSWGYFYPCCGASDYRGCWNWFRYLGIGRLAGIW